MSAVGVTPASLSVQPILMPICSSLILSKPCPENENAGCPLSSVFADPVILTQEFSSYLEHAATDTTNFHQTTSITRQQSYAGTQTQRFEFTELQELSH